MTEYVLGIFKSKVDTSAALLKNGDLIALGEEERFSRNKHAFEEFPIESIKFCLEKGGIDLGDVDRIVYPWDATKYPLQMSQFFLDGWHKYDKDQRTLEWEKNNLERFRPEVLTEIIKDELTAEELGPVPEVEFYNHHQSHAASAYYYSNFDSAAVLTVDGHGEENAVVGWHADGGLNKVFSYEIPNSLGWFYSSITAYLGFRPYNGEGKVMGLAAYGESDPEIASVLQEMLQVDENGFSIDPSYIFYGEHSHHERFTDKLVEALDHPPREHPGELTEFHENVAYVAQDRLESALKTTAKRLLDETGESKLCLAGGVAYNCKANKQLREDLDVDGFFVQPISGEPGATIGAGFLAQDRDDTKPMTDVYYGWGPKKSDIETAVRQNSVEVITEERDQTRTKVASLLADGEIIGRYSGNMECGPRALGNRSILADPRDREMLDAVNKVKKRDSWRPFAPTILAEHGRDVLDTTNESVDLDSFMIQTYDVDPKWTERIEAAVHVDGTTRPQLLSKENNEYYWKLLTEFYEITDVPAVLNTSFNLAGDPIVRTPEEAIETYHNSDIDYLQLGPLLVE